MQSLLKWWLIFWLIILGIGISIYFNLHIHLFNEDITKISFLILGVFAVTTAWIGRQTYEDSKGTVRDATPMDLGWFIAESCLALGMIGTVTGFLFMLGQTFVGIDVSNAMTLQNALMTMAKGMSTALYTTLTGLISSLLIKVQLINLEVGRNNV
tara:strand:+ start:1255 stop:1719 length:465 start_codon:yes stop_codon:yes gene_type:complete